MLRISRWLFGLAALAISSCGKVEKTIVQKAQTHATNKAPEVLAVLHDAAPELAKVQLRVEDLQFFFGNGQSTVTALALFQGDPPESNRFVRIVYRSGAESKPQVLKLTRGVMEEFWTPPNQHGAKWLLKRVLEEKSF